MKLRSRIAWIALLAAAGTAGCHHAAVPDGSLYPRNGLYEFRITGMTPPVTGQFTIADEQVYLDIRFTSVRCVPFADRRYHEPPGIRAFECTGISPFPVVDVQVSLRDPVHSSTWWGTNIAEEPHVQGRECVQTGLDARGQKVCLAYRTVTSTRNAQKSGKLDVVRKGPG
jgi:hypothetical protein